MIDGCNKVQIDEILKLSRKACNKFAILTIPIMYKQILFLHNPEIVFCLLEDINNNTVKFIVL